MSDLFPSEQAQASKEDRIDWYNAFAVEKLGMPPRWRWFKLEVKNHGKPSSFISVTGAVCDAKIERGKRKGSDSWKKRDKATEAELAVYDKDLTAFKLDWQNRTGKCFHCQGSGKIIAGFSVKDGAEYRGCLKCGGTGYPVKAEAAA